MVKYVVAMVVKIIMNMVVPPVVYLSKGLLTNVLILAMCIV